MKIEEIAGALRVARGESGLTQEELADKVGTTQPVISYIENGILEKIWDVVSDPKNKKGGVLT